MQTPRVTSLSVCGTYLKRPHTPLVPSAILKRTGGSMCSINGILYHDRGRLVDEAVLVRMRAVQQHRGPDERGLWTGGHVGFGFNRLATIDLASGHQPMTNEDGSVSRGGAGDFLNRSELERLLDSHQQCDHTQQLLALIVFDQWVRLFELS